MNILVIQKWLVVGGVERALISYLKLWQQLGWQIDLHILYDLEKDNFFQAQIPNGINYRFVFNQDYQIKREQKRLRKIRLRQCGLQHKLSYEWFKLQEKFLFYKEIRRIAAAKPYDAVFDFSGECLNDFIRLPGLLKYGMPPTVRWIHSDLNGNRPLSDKNFRKYHRIFQNHRLNLCLTPAMAVNLSAQFTGCSEKFRVLPNPIDMAHIRQQAEQPLPPEYQNTPYLFQAARLCAEKGHEALIHIFKELKNRGFSHKLIIAGEGDNRAALQQLIDTLGLHDDCILPGAVNNPYPLFKHADLFLHTAEHEGLGLVLLESMACGTPVVAMDCPTGPKFILGENSEYGRLIAMHDKQAFADAVAELLQNRERHRHYREQGLKRAEDFSMENIGMKMQTLLRESLS